MKIKIAKILKDGAYSVADAYLNPREYVAPSGFPADLENLEKDVRRFGESMKKAVKHYEQQANAHSRNKR